MSDRWRPLRGEHIEARALAGALRRLLDSTDLSLAQLAEVIPFGKSTISDKLNGRSRPQWAFVEAVVAACAHRDPQARLILEKRFRRLWEQADPDHATLLPLNTPQQSGVSRPPDADPPVRGELRAIVATLNSIAAKQDRVAEAQLALSRSHELCAGVIEFQRRLEVSVEELVVERKDLHQERDRPAAERVPSAGLDEELAAVQEQLADTERRLEAARALQNATEQRLRVARRQRRLADRLRAQAVRQLDEALAAVAETAPRSTQDLAVLQVAADPWTETSAPPASGTLFSPDGRRMAAAVLGRMDDELMVVGAGLAGLETAITEGPDVGSSSWDNRGSGRSALGSWHLPRGRRALVLVLSTLVGAGAAVAVAVMASGSPDGTYTVRGTLTCSSGNRVVGAWLQGSPAKGWAHLDVTGNGTAEYSYELPRGETYSLHVGCGGTPKNWAVDPHTSEVSGTRNSFDCYDAKDSPYYRSCQTRTGS